MISALPLVFALSLAATDAGVGSPEEPHAFPPQRIEPGVSALPASAFAFDEKQPFALETVGTERRGKVTVSDLRFASGPREVKAFLVEPEGKGPFAAVLYVHWLGEEKSDRTEFLDEAVGLARKGAVSLLVDGMWAQPGWYGKRKHETDSADAIAQVIDLQRAMQLLTSRKNVDSKRVAFVGHDFGAMYGAIAGAVRPVAKTYVFLAPTTTFHEWFLLGRKKPADLDAYVRQLAPLDPIRYVGQLAPASVFLQFAKVDRYVAPDRMETFFAHTREPRLMKIYESSDHSMRSTDGVNERYRWLALQLGLDRSELTQTR